MGIWQFDRRRYDDRVGARLYDPKEDVSGGQHTEELAEWIDDYCRANPTDRIYTDRIYDASAALIRKFRETASP